MKWSSARHPYVLPMVVVPDDIDSQGIASNVAILAWMNRAAIAHSTAAGYDWAAYRRLGTMFVVRRHELDYHRSATLGERILLRTWPGSLRGATCRRFHEVVSARDGQLIARGMNVWAYIDREARKPQRIHAEILAAFDPEQFI
jgi:acyl-CoA thioester hydrolase